MFDLDFYAGHSVNYHGVQYSILQTLRSFKQKPDTVVALVCRTDAMFPAPVSVLMFKKDDIIFSNNEDTQK